MAKLKVQEQLGSTQHALNHNHDLYQEYCRGLGQANDTWIHPCSTINASNGKPIYVHDLALRIITLAFILNISADKT